MKNEKCLGIWMDHSHANLMEFTASGEVKDIPFKFSNSNKHHVGMSEDIIHNREQHNQMDFYKHLEDVIKKYDVVLLFGPTNAKAELKNHLKTDHHFDKIKIEVKASDKMTENQQHAFVKDYFSN